MASHEYWDNKDLEADYDRLRRPTTANMSTLAPGKVISKEEFEQQLKSTRLFETGATRDTDQSKLDYEGFLSPQVLRRFAEYMHECRLRNIPPGQELRSSDNWQKGIPKEAYMKSMLRHVMELWEQHRADSKHGGNVDKNVEQTVLCAIMFNVMGYLYEDLNGR